MFLGYVVFFVSVFGPPSVVKIGAIVNFVGRNGPNKFFTHSFGRPRKATKCECTVPFWFFAPLGPRNNVIYKVS